MSNDSQSPSQTNPASVGGDAAVVESPDRPPPVPEPTRLTEHLFPTGAQAIAPGNIPLPPSFRERYQLVQFIRRDSTSVEFRALRRSGRGDEASRSLSIVFGALEPYGTEPTCDHEALKRLQHPNVVQVFDIGVASGHPYVVTEYLERGSLRERMAVHHQIMAAEAAATMVDILAGVQAFHEAGLVHGQLAPEAVLFDNMGRAKVRHPGPAGGIPRVPEEQASSYQAPELVEGAAAGPQSDIYGVGVLLYELLGGQGSVGGIRRKLPPIQSKVDGVPDRLAELLERAMAAAPEERPRTADEFAAQLMAAAEPPRRLTGRRTGRSMTPVTPPRPMSRVPLAVLGLLVVGMVFTGMLLAVKPIRRVARALPSAVPAVAVRVAPAAPGLAAVQLRTVVAERARRHLAELGMLVTPSVAPPRQASSPAWMIATDTPAYSR